MKNYMLPVAVVLLLHATRVLAQGDVDGFRKAIRNGDAEKIVPALHTYVTAHASEPQAWVVLGEAYLQTGKPDSAEFAGRKAVAINDDYLPAYPMIGLGLAGQKKAGEAVETMDAALRRKKNDPMLLTGYGNVLVSLDSLDAAIVYFSKAREADENYVEAYEGLGDAYMKQNAATMAAMQYEKLLAVDSLRPDVRFKLARAYIRDQRYGDAAEMYHSLLRQDSTNAAAKRDLGKIYFAAQQYANAANWMGQYLAMEPDAKELFPFYLDALFASKQYPAALDVAARMLKGNARAPKPLRITAEIHFVQKNYPASIDAYTKLAAADTLRADDMQRLAKAHQQTAQDSLAAGVYERFLAKFPNDGDAMGELGTLYMKMRKYDKAAAVFKQRFTQDPAATGAYVNYGLCNMAMAKWEEARVALVEAVSKKPDYLQGRVFLARCLSQMDSIRGAQREYEALIALTAGSEEKYKTELAEAHGMIGFSFLLDKKFPQSIAALTTSIKYKDDNPQTRLWRAQAYALGGKRDDAIKEYKVVLKLDPKNKDAKKGLEILGQK